MRRNVSVAWLAMGLAGTAVAEVVVYEGLDPGRGPGESRPNSDQAAADFRAAVVGVPGTVDFEDQPIGFFNMLEVAPGVVAEMFDMSDNAGIRGDRGSNVLGYNTTADGAKYVRFDTPNPAADPFGSPLTGRSMRSGRI